MAKHFDEYSSFRVETVKPKPAPKRRRFKLSILLFLVVAWALLLQVMEKTFR
jgi:hypothetical protein